MMKKGKQSKKKKSNNQDLPFLALPPSNMFDTSMKNVVNLKEEYEGNSKSENTAELSRPTSNVSKKSTSSSNRNIGRAQLFENPDIFEKTDYYPLEQVKRIATQIKDKSSSYSLDFTGLEQLTDIVFVLMLTNGDLTKFSQVESLNLTGCIHLTDNALKWISTVFSNLKKLILQGCYRVTEAGVKILLKNCKSLQELCLTGTSVSILPIEVVGMQIEFDGCPLISPDPKMLQSPGSLSIMKASTYKKSSNIEMMKICVVKTDGVSQSFAKYLAGDKDLTVSPVAVKEYKFKFKEADVTGHIIECDKVTMDYFVTKRSLVVVTYDANTKRSVDSVSKEIAAIIIQAVSKIDGLAFVIAGLGNGKTTLTDKSVKDAVEGLIKAAKHRLQTYVHTFLKSDKKLEGIAFQSQEECKILYSLMEKLEFVHILSLGVDLSKTKKDQAEIDKTLGQGTEIVVDLNPIYQDLGAPVYLHAASDLVPKMLKDGVLSMLETKASSQFTMQIIEHYGRAVCLQLLGEPNMVLSPSWFANILSVALSRPPDGTTNNTAISCVSDSQVVWKITELKKELEKKLPKDQATQAVALLMKLNIGFLSSEYFIPYVLLEEKPPIDLTKTLETNSKNRIHTTYKYQFLHNVSDSTMHFIQGLAHLMRRPLLLWKYGIVEQEGLVDVIIKLEHAQDQSSIELTAQTPFQSTHGVSQQETIEMLWLAVEQYKLIVDYVIKRLNLSAQITCFSDKPKPDFVHGFVNNHKFQAPPGENENETKQDVCSHCGFVASACKSLLAMYEYLYPAQITEELLQNKAGFYKREGNIISRTQQKTNAESKEDDTVSFKTKLNPYDSSKFCFTIIEGTPKNIWFGIRSADGSVVISVSFSKQALLMSGPKNPAGDKVMPLPADIENTAIGQSFEIHMEPSLESVGKGLWELQIFRGVELMGKLALPQGNYYPVLRIEQELNKDALALVMVHGSFITMSKITDVFPGMRCEALDRLNPSLICVATINDIDDSGKFLIHFDGWTSRYDYWTEPETVDIHPVGFMAAVGHKNKNNQPKLQAPKGYGKDFDWPTYCEEMKCLPVPYEFFNDGQKEGTSQEQENKVLEHLGEGTVGNSFAHATPCGRTNNSAKAIEFQAMKECTLQKDVISFFTSHNKHFCLWPPNMTADDLRYPFTNRIVANPDQRIHFLCSGNKMELLHFIDDEGLPLSTYSTSIPNLAPFLEMCYIGLILQDNVFPAGVKKLCTGLPDGNEEESLPNIEFAIKKVCFQYLMMMIVYAKKLPASKQKQKYADTQIMLQRVSEDTTAMERLKTIFNGIQGSGVIKCQSHNLSMSSGKELKSINIEAFKMSYHFMQKLDFQNNAITELEEGFLKKFTRLEELNLSQNLLTSLPIGLSKSKILTHLMISNNKIKEIPDCFGDLQDTLTVLDISGNPLGKLPPFVLKLTNLVELRADNIGTVDMTGIGNMKDLEVLSLSYNIIESVPGELGDLPLVELCLAGVPWFPHLVTGNTKTQPTYPAFKNILASYNVFGLMDEESLKGLFQNMDKDSSGTLQKEELITLNDHIFEKYPRFGQKKLSNKQYGGIPEPIFKLTKLEKLDLSFHGLTQISDNMKVFESLHHLDVSHNPTLESLPGVLGGLPLKDLNLKGCTSMKTPPKEVIGRGFSAIYGYLKRLQQGAVSCRRTKLMMVGLGGAGKTSLVEALTSSRNRANMNLGEQITDGIDISMWNCKAPSGEDITYSVWDFAGQTVYYNTHQFFLSNRAVYLLLWNIRLGYEHAGLDFWLSSVACHAPKAPILVVGTHCDKVKKSKIPTDELMKRFPQIAGFHFVSSYTGEGIGNLKNSLLIETAQQKYMGEKIPEAWLKLETKLVQFREEQNLDLLPWSKVEKTSNTVGIFDELELIQAVQFLHDLGSVQFFNTEFLKSHIVIYPQWIVDVMACIVTVHEGPIKEGKLLHENMKIIWEKYDQSLHPWLLRLTEEFDLTFPLVDEPANLVPCLLPTEEPEYTWPTLEPGSYHREFKMIYKFVYLPAGLFNRAQVRLNQFSDGGLIWKKGSFLKKSGHIALMLQQGTTEVLVKAQGYKPENLLFLVHEMFETLISQSYGGVQYEFQIPCLECQNMNVSEPSMFSSSKIHRATELNAPFLQCDRLFHTISIPELKGVMPPEKSENLDDHLRRSVQELQGLGEEINLNVFFCYSKRNIPDLANEKKAVHPGTIMEDLRSSGFNISFTDTPETADLEMLTLSFKAAKVIMIGMSDEFCQDETCKKLILFIKDTLRKPMLLVILGQTQEWKKSSIGMSLGNEVYVKLKDLGRYPTGIKDLQEALKKKAKKQDVVEDIPKCFLSYCWANSEDAISKGTAKKESALGWADPRKMKDFLTKNGISTWLDIERVGGGGLFEDIADGLRKAKVVVACVSDEYAQSRNCAMEFRFALSQLRIPVVLAVVGTGYAWERSEIGMLAVGGCCPKINFQNPNESGFADLLKYVKENLPEDVMLQIDPEKFEAQRKAAFQEAIELSQRQFLRHLTSYADSMYSSHYPRLIVVDIAEKPKTEEELEIEMEEKYSNYRTLLAENKEENKATQEELEHVLKEHQEEVELQKKKQKYCWRLLCEHEQGWHEVSPTVPFPDIENEEEEVYLSEIAPYAARIFALLKYTNIKLDSLNTPEGKRLQEKLESYAAEANKSDFQEEYCSIRSVVMEQDINREMGGLRRCHMMSGKTLWLCDEHAHDSGSKTDQRFKDQLATSNETTDDVTEDNADIRPTTAAKQTRSSETTGRVTQKDSRAMHQSSLFKMREAKGKNNSKLKRQTSQACSVM